jgi:hypothetical protein
MFPLQQQAELAMEGPGNTPFQTVTEVETMKRLCGLLCALLFALAFGAGCADDSPFKPAIDDWNGKNMQMQGFSSDDAAPRSHSR